MTDPAGTVDEDWVVTVPTTSPAPVMAVEAADCVRPTTFGTDTDAGPDDTARFTAVPGATEVPDVGFCDMTDPAGTVDEDWVVTVPTTSPAPVMAVEAADCVRPTTFGTDTDAGPDDTTRFTAVPGATEVPDVGFCDMTDPAGTVDEDWVVTVPTTSPAPVMAVEAADCVRPTTFGTDTDTGPDETTRFTAVPGATEVPDVGFCDITDPAGTVDEDWVVTVPTTSPAPVMAVEAADCVRLTTFGTDTDAELIVTLVGTDVA